MKTLRRGILLALEGIDGAGKTTQAALLKAVLETKNFPVVTLKEPTNRKYGKQIKKLVHEHRNLSPSDELKLFIKDRRDHVTNEIKPLLKKKVIVIMDRYFYSTAAYQGVLEDVGKTVDAILQQNRQFAPEPDLTIILDVPPRVGLWRIKNGRNNQLTLFEKEAYLEMVREKFLDLKSHSVQVMDGTRPIETVFGHIFNMVIQLVNSREK